MEKIINNIAEEDIKYSSSIVAFIDLLGFSAAIKKNSFKAHELYALINNLKSFATSTESCERIDKGYKIEPAITQFSDSICISISPQEKVYNDIPAPVKHFFMLKICNLIDKISCIALRYGFLIRGGIAMGEIYHKNGIIYGKAFLEAYHIEQNIAEFPRIVLSDQIADFIVNKSLYLEDIDGKYILNNIAHLNIPDVMHNSDSDWRDKSYQQLIGFRDTINSNLQKLIKEKANIKTIHKWLWFKNKFELRHNQYIADYQNSDQFSCWQPKIE